MLSMKTVLVVVLVLVAARYAGAESAAGVVMVPGGFSGYCTTYTGSYWGNPTFALIPKSAGARTGKVWVRSGWDGICIEGRVYGPAPEWAAKPSALLRKDHVEVWLATAPHVTVPLIGWGNQFGEAKLKSASVCEEKADSFPGVGNVDKARCREWYAKQIPYRALLRRLFVRQWAIAGEKSEQVSGPTSAHVEEEFASQAWRDLGLQYFQPDLPVKLKPRQFDGVEAFAGKAKQGYGFAVFIPYSAFPPMPHLVPRDLWLMVDVFSPARPGMKTGPYSTTSARRVWGDPATFNHIRLERPLDYALSPCRDALAERNLYGDKLPGWFFPVEPKSAKDSPVVIGKDFVLANPAHGYLYQPGGMSPEVVTHTHFWKKLGPGEWVCGPHMGLRRAGVTYWAVPVKTQSCTTVKTSAHSSTRSCWTQVTRFDLSKRGLDAKVLGDGGVLVKSGPYSTTLSAFGSGMCGLCTVANLDFYTISPDGKAGKALELDSLVSGDPGQPIGVDFTISPDWKLVREYEQFEGKSGWISKKYCFDGDTYKKCGGSPDAKPPSPPNYPQYAPPPQ